MFEWSEGCKSYSFLWDHYNPAIIHLNQRDVAMVTVSRASLHKVEAYKKRMGWTFKWVSSLASDYYNYRVGKFPAGERPGISVFYKNAGGEVFPTYSSFARGLENFIGTYALLDIVPKGRDQGALAYGLKWVRRHDQYETKSASA
jgi:predicted dithiol-disulfide oxidoreductase (DUF899 family)